MPITHLPANPSLENLKKQAKTLHRAACDARASTEHAAAVDLVNEFHPRAGAALPSFSLSDAQLVVARRYGFSSWPRMKDHVVAVQQLSRSPHVAPTALPTDPAGFADEFVRLACLNYGGDHVSRREKARELLAAHPEIRADFCVMVTIGDAAGVGARLQEKPQLARMQGGPHRWEPLLYACYSRADLDEPGLSTLAVARLLLDHGADPNAGYLWEGTYPFTALTGAFGEGEAGPTQQPPHRHCEELARLLLEAGADPNDTQTLYNRMFSRNDDHLKLLFAYGLGKDQGGPWLRRLGERLDSPAQMLVEQLWWAAGHNHPERIELLVEHGADVNAAGVRDGRTIYETAALSGNRAIAEYLLQHGARKIELSPEQAFEVACVGGDRASARALLDRHPGLLAKLGDRGRAELLARAAASGKQDGVRLMAELGFDLDAMRDNAAMHQAAWQGDLAMVKLLVALGAATNIRDCTHHATPLSWASYNAQAAVVDFLLPLADVFDAVQLDQVERLQSLLDADPALARARDRLGQTPLHWLHANVKRGAATIGMLVAAGADVDAAGLDGKRALEKLAALGRDDLVDELRRHGATG